MLVCCVFHIHFFSMLEWCSKRGWWRHQTLDGTESSLWNRYLFLFYSCLPACLSVAFSAASSCHLIELRLSACAIQGTRDPLFLTGVTFPSEYPIYEETKIKLSVYDVKDKSQETVSIPAARFFFSSLPCLPPCTSELSRMTLKLAMDRVSVLGVQFSIWSAP